MTEITRVATDTSKAVFTIHAVDAQHRPVLRRNLRRREVAAFFGKLPAADIVIEACGASHHWARTLQALGHRVRLIPAHYMKPSSSAARTTPTPTPTPPTPKRSARPQPGPARALFP